MDTISIISNIIEYTKKAEELTEEQSSLGITCSTLYEIIKDIDTSKLPKELMCSLQSQLEESKGLLEQTSVPQSKLGSILQNIKNMIPGSKLQQIKEKNTKLLELSHLISVHLQTRQFKKQLSSEIETDIVANYFYCPLLKRQKDSDNTGGSDKTNQLGPTLIAQPELATLREEDEKSSNNNNQQQGMIGELKLIATNDVEQIFKINLEWSSGNGEESQVVHQFEREQYLFLDNLARYFSRLHAVVIAKQIKIINNNNSNVNSNNKNSQQNDKNQEEPNDNLLDVKEEQKKADLFMTVAENLEDDEEDNKSKKEDNKKVLSYVSDRSSNGTYILKKQFWFDVTGEQNNPLNTNTQWQKIQKNAEIELEVGDIIGLILDKTTHTKLILGYMFQ